MHTFLLLGNLFTLLAKSKGFFILLLLQLQKEKKAREEQEKRDAEEAAERQQREEEWVRKWLLPTESHPQTQLFSVSSDRKPDSIFSLTCLPKGSRALGTNLLPSDY